MQFTKQAVLYSLLSSTCLAFVPSQSRHMSPLSRVHMAADMPAPEAADVTVVTPAARPRVGGAPSPIRYSEFLKLVDDDQIEKVTFSSDGTKLLGVDTDGGRLRIDALPNDPDLLNSLTKHKVSPTCIYVASCFLSITNVDS